MSTADFCHLWSCPLTQCMARDCIVLVVSKLTWGYVLVPLAHLVLGEGGLFVYVSERKEMSNPSSPQAKQVGINKSLQTQVRQSCSARMLQPLKYDLCPSLFVKQIQRDILRPRAWKHWHPWVTSLMWVALVESQENRMVCSRELQTYLQVSKIGA